MKKTFELGKIAYTGDKKSNLVTVEIELNEKDGKEVFTACGNVWNTRKTNIVTGGQCLDELAKYIHTDIFKTIYRLWKQYHLNDMHAGTEEQENALKEAVKEGKLQKYGANNYEETCNYLKSIDLYEVEHQGKPYKYGHGWLYREIPEEDLQIIKSLF